MVMAHGVERGGESRTRRRSVLRKVDGNVLFAETVFSVALLIMCLSSLSVTFGKFFVSNLWDYLHKTM